MHRRKSRILPMCPMLFVLALTLWLAPFPAEPNPEDAAIARSVVKKRGDATTATTGSKRRKKSPDKRSAQKNTALEIELELLGEETLMVVPPRSLVGLGHLPFSFAELPEPDEFCVKPGWKVTKKEIDLWKGDKKGSASMFLRKGAMEEYRKGRLSSAITYMEGALKYTPRDWETEVSGYNILLATYYAKAGNFSKATSLFKRHSHKLKRSASNNFSRLCRTRGFYWLARGKAVIAFAKGDLPLAERHFIEAEKALDDFQSAPQTGNCRWTLSGLSGPWRKSELVLGRAEVALWQGRTIEAEALAREAYKISFMTEALITLSDIYFEQGRFEDALRVAAGAIDRFNVGCVPSDAFQRARAYEQTARALIGLRRWQEAADVFAQLEALLRTDVDTWNRQFRVNRDRGIALLRVGEVREARAVLEAVAKEQSERLGRENYQALEGRAFLAVAMAESGERPGALALMREVVPSMLERWRDAGGDSVKQVGRMFRLRLIAEAYLRLLLDGEWGGTTRDPGRLAEAFQIADAVGTRGLQRALAESTARSLAKDEATAQLIRERQDLEKRITALRFRLTQAYGSAKASTKTVLDPLHAEVERATAVLGRLENRIAKEFPEYAELTNPKPVSLSQARVALRADEALILTFVGEETLFVWAVPRQGQALVAVAPMGRTELKRTVDKLRRALSPDAETLDEIPEFDVVLAHELYQQVLGPVAGAWAGQKRLLLVADGALGTLPLAVLPTEAVTLGEDRSLPFERYRAVPWLARTYAVARLPSVASLLTLRRDAVSTGPLYAFVGFGDPWFERGGGQAVVASTRGVGAKRIALRSLAQTRSADSAGLSALPRLPDTAEEIRAVAEALGANLDRDVYLGLDASERRVKALNGKGELKKYRTLSFATHGLVPGDLDGLEKPALALSAPTPQEEKLGDDGLLTSDEILGLRLDADWVVLSACNTAAADGAGAGAVSGLGRAFFYAGAKAILVSNWAVHSDATRALMVKLFQAYASSGNRGRADALRAAMLHLMDEGGYRADGKVLFTYAHPLFWAPFTVVGDGG